MLHELMRSLPEWLLERTRLLEPDRAPTTNGEGEFVLYWMHHAARGHENPALDTAKLFSTRLGLPLLVYQGLGGAHRFNSDRHHAFIMEGARDVARELARDRIRHVFSLPTDPGAPSPLRRLADRAAVLVAEDFPAPPFPSWTRKLADRCGKPIAIVDCACVVPMRLVDGQYERAFKFRSKTSKLFEKRVGRAWPRISDEPIDASKIDPGFDPIDWSTASIPELIASCDIDHGLAPIAHTPGGSLAGYARWERFKEVGLRSYHRRRNRADLPRDSFGVSRLSAYIHHGHVSPLRLLRDADALRQTDLREGAEKFIDELWVWRELAHHLCFTRTEQLEKLSVLPSWAKETLKRHERDARDNKSSVSLARARSGSDLWDAAQRSLLAHGELHNNIRMTWGKAVPAWTPNASVAQQELIDLNHRHALDGNDPNSYGGLLWCLGVFDRPFEEEHPVTGVLRTRPVETHAARMDIDRYVREMKAPSWGKPLSVAVIGGGISGLAAARVLCDHNAHVTVFDKGRGPGGRASTRRDSEHRFDHGAQYFTARDTRFKRVVDSWVQDGVAAVWDGSIGSVDAPGEIHPKHGGPARYVGVPGMNAIVKDLAETLGEHGEVRFGTRVDSLSFENARWNIFDEDGGTLGAFDALVVAVPAPQAAALLRDQLDPSLLNSIERAELAPCWSVMLSFDERLPIQHDGMFMNIPGHALSWVSRDSSKPSRPPGERWVLHAGPDWTSRHIDADREQIVERLLREFESAVGIELPEQMYAKAHRWRYALPARVKHEKVLFDADRHACVCGDWLHGGRIEGAYLSGIAAGGRLLGRVVGESRRATAPLYPID